MPIGPAPPCAARASIAWTSSGMSPARSRSGGISIRITLSRKNRSSRNWPACTASSITRLVAAITRTSVATSPPPTGRTRDDSSTWSSLLWTSSGISAISSRKIVPPEASTNRPSRDSRASVNAPRRTPNSSASTSPLGSAAQLTWTNGPLPRPPRSWIQRASAPLPVPLSPVISTLAIERDARRATSSTFCIAGLAATSAPRSSPSSRRSRTISRRIRRSRSARSTASSSAGSLNGLVTKSHAPARTACTASSMLPNAVIMRTSWPGLRSSSSARRSVPRSSGISTSVMTMSKSPATARSIPARAEVSPTAV